MSSVLSAVAVASSGKPASKPKRKTGRGLHVLAGPGRGGLSPAERDGMRYTPADVARARAEGYAAGVEGYHAAILRFFRAAWAEYPIDAAQANALRRALYALADRQIQHAQTA